MQPFDPNGPLGRRAFLRDGTLLLATAHLTSRTTSAERAGAPGDNPKVRFGLLTDLHYADKPPAGSRHYRETLDKLAEAGEHFARHDLDFVVELGDLIDAADAVDVELGYLERINRDFATIHAQRHYVLGNHCVDMLKKDEFLDGIGQARSYDSFDVGGFHFIVLDACYRSDGQPYGRKNFEWTDPNIPTEEVEWLKADLARTSKPTLVFAHQRLDVGSPYGVKNAPEVRMVFEAAGNVLAVFQGHSHQNDYRELAGIHYCTMVAMVEGSGLENSGAAIVELEASGPIQVHGFRTQANYRWRV